MDISYRYNQDVKPVLDENKKWCNTRASKETRYHNYHLHKSAPLADKERWSINILKMALSNSKEPILACSFGIDSIVSLYLARKALIELGKNPNDLRVVWCDTANEFKDVRQYQLFITKEWNLNLTVMKPKKTLKHIINAYGGGNRRVFYCKKRR